MTAPCHTPGQAPALRDLPSATGPYRIPGFEYTVQCVLTKKCQQGVFRGAGTAEPTWFSWNPTLPVRSRTATP